MKNSPIIYPKIERRGGESMGHGILLSGGADVDFMIHGIFQYSFFGHQVWITTTHVCVLIVMLILIAFSVAAGQCMKHAA